jgi:poly(beta-D-mannuronate) lyase
MWPKTLLILLILVSPILATDYQVSNAADIDRLFNLRPGDVVILADGTWTDQTITFKGMGDKDNPITFRPQTPGKVILNGQSSLKIEGQHLLVSGLFFKDASATTDAITLTGHHNRLTDCAVVGGKHKFFVRLYGTHNRVDHCYLAEKTSDSPTLQVEAEGKPNNHLIEFNHFGHRPPLGKNGGETIRVGYSWQSLTSAATTVQSNLFDRCDGELEIISSKSCDNIYRNNTFLACAGFFTLRHGNRNTVDANYFLGQGKRGSGGIRIIGEDHTVSNNYIADVTDGAFRITSGIVNSELRGYFQSIRCTVAGNLVINSKGPYLELDAGINSSRRTLRPEKITIASNIFILPQSGGQLLKGKEGETWTWKDNIAWNLPVGGEFKGIDITDPKLQIGKDGIHRTPGGGPIAKSPLTAKDVGPSWSLDFRSQTPDNSAKENRAKP